MDAIRESLLKLDEAKTKKIIGGECACAIAEAQVTATLAVAHELRRVADAYTAAGMTGNASAPALDMAEQFKRFADFYISEEMRRVRKVADLLSNEAELSSEETSSHEENQKAPDKSCYTS